MVYDLMESIMYNVYLQQIINLSAPHLYTVYYYGLYDYPGTFTRFLRSLKNIREIQSVKNNYISK